MPPYSEGDHFTVTDEAAPFFGATGVVEEIEENTLYPVVSTITKGTYTGSASYKISEITPLYLPVPVLAVEEMGT